MANAPFKRLPVTVLGALVALGIAAGIAAASAPSRSTALDATLELVTAGTGQITVTPGETEDSSVCIVQVQQPVNPEACTQHYEKGTKVTLTAAGDGTDFFAWGDSACAVRNPKCKLTLGAGTRFVTASFTPVTLKIEGDLFGRITVKPGGSCNPGVDDCAFNFPWGTEVTLTRQHGADGKFWQGACYGNTDGQLLSAAAVCKLTLHSDELVGAGVGVPPPLGTGIAIKRGGKGRGRVKGQLVGGTKTLDCGGRCIIANIDRDDYVKLRAIPVGKSCFYRWSDPLNKKSFNQQRTRTVPMEATNKLTATFVKKTSRCRH